MQRILFITSSYPFGKGESFIEEELSSLSQYFNLDLLPTYPRGEAGNHTTECIKSINGKLHGLKLFSMAYFFHFFLFTFFNFKLLCKLFLICVDNDFIKTFRNIVLIPKSIYFYKKYMSSGQYDFIYCHWLSAPAQLSLLLSVISGIPFGVTAHRWDIVDNNNFQKKINKAYFIRVISDKSIKLFPSSIVANYGDKIKRIYLGVKVQEAVFQRELLRKKVYNAVCIGSLQKVKGHKYLFHAIKKLNELGITINLKIVGDGELRDELESLAISLGVRGQVLFSGNIEHSAVLNIIASREVDFVCLPSIDLGGGFHEGIPVALMESMSFGLPCISTLTGSISELIQDKENGLLVSDKNSTELAYAIQLLLSDDKLYSSISTNSALTIDRFYNSQKNNLSIIELISNGISLKSSKDYE